MNGRTVFGFFALLALASSGCGGSDAAPAVEVDVPVHPGACVGTTCMLPKIERLDSDKTAECTSPALNPAPTVWSKEPGLAVCPFGQCPLVPIDVAAAADGSIWGLASVLSTQDVPIRMLGQNDVGTALVRFDASGAELARSEPEIALGLRRATELSLGLHPTSDGGVLWVGPGHGTTGVALRRYNAKGKLASAHWLVEHALQSDSVVDEHGSFVLYEYRESVDLDASPPEPTTRAGLARFDAHGKVLWNQSALASLPFQPRQATLVGVDPEGNATVAIDSEQPKGVPVSPSDFPAMFVVRVAPDGGILWVRELAGDLVNGATLTPDGKVVLVTGFVGDTLHVIAADGSSLAGVTVSGFDSDGSAAGSSDAEHVWLYGRTQSATGDGLVATRAALDGSSCPSFSIDVPATVQYDDAFYGDDSRFAFLGPNRVALTTIRAFGVVDLGGAP